MPIFNIEAPRLDVAGNEQSRIGNSGDATTFIIIRQDGSAEKPLTNSLINEGLCDGFAFAAEAELPQPAPVYFFAPVKLTRKNCLNAAQMLGWGGACRD